MYKFLKGINILLVVVFLLAILIKVAIHPSFEGGVGFRIFVSVALSLFMVPYLLSVLAFSRRLKMRKSAIITSVIWCFFIIVGVTVQKQGAFVNALCSILLIVSAANIFFLVKGSKPSAEGSI